ncbi:AVAST type 1 anti-phage system protein Avs1c [Acinetobacter baumannii]
MERMETPNTRSEFEYRFHLLKDKIEKGKFHVNRGISLEGLRKVRYLPNGRIDFLSVDEQARVTVNTMAQMQNMEFLENIAESAVLHKD